MTNWEISRSERAGLLAVDGLHLLSRCNYPIPASCVASLFTLSAPLPYPFCAPSAHPLPLYAPACSHALSSLCTEAIPLWNTMTYSMAFQFSAHFCTSLCPPPLPVYPLFPSTTFCASECPVPYLCGAVWLVDGLHHRQSDYWHLTA